MQDKFAIGPVTIVQLVGLTTKPRIASAQVDAAVRAADPLPPASAAAGIGHDLQENVDEVATVFFDIKAPQMLSLTAATMHGGISLEAGADRPAAGNDGPKPGDSEFNFDNLPANFDLAALIASLRGGSPTAGTPNADSPPPVVEPNAPAPGTDTIPETAAATPSPAATEGGDALVFDGAESFGDDKILDFEGYYAEAGLVGADAKLAANSESAEMVLEIQEFFAADLGAFHIIDVAGGLSPEPTLFNDDFAVPQHQIAANDAIAPI